MKRALLPILIVLLAACSDSNNNNNAAAVDDPPPPAPEPEPNAVFMVSTTNLTVAQPLSPLAVIVHDDSVRAFSIGEAASEPLEILAEGGDNSEVLAAIPGAGQTSGEAPLGPGASEELSVELGSSDTTGMRLTVVSMLVNTNDAITGLNSVDVSELAVGESITVSSLAYDTGTEANSEAAGTIPGPADGGEGFNAVRDDVADQVTAHPGVVTADDGLSSSTLNQSHRWDNPVARFTITRSQ